MGAFFCVGNYLHFVRNRTLLCVLARLLPSYSVTPFLKMANSALPCTSAVVRSLPEATSMM